MMKDESLFLSLAHIYSVSQHNLLKILSSLHCMFLWLCRSAGFSCADLLQMFISVNYFRCMDSLFCSTSPWVNVDGIPCCLTHQSSVICFEAKYCDTASFVLFCLRFTWLFRVFCGSLWIFIFFFLEMFYYLDQSSQVIEFHTQSLLSSTLKIATF